MTMRTSTVIKRLKELEKNWPDNLELFAYADGCLLLYLGKTGEVIEEFSISCDGGDPDYEMIDGIMFLDRCLSP